MIPLPPINPDGSYSTDLAGMAVDGDGANGFTSAPVYAPKGYHPEPMDYLANAGEPGNWYGVVTDSDGEPFEQSASDPAPGAYVSATSYEWPAYGRHDPRRYVDANSVPFIVIPSHWRAQARGVVLGCRATVTDTRFGTVIEAGVMDFGPCNKLGEASIACARSCGVPCSPKDGGTDEKRFIYRFWPGISAVLNSTVYPLIPA